MKYYSEIAPQVLDENGRHRMAKQIGTVLSKEVGTLENLSCLEVGSSNGIISSDLSKLFKKFIATDIDAVAIKDGNKKFKSKKLKFIVMSAEKLSFNDNSFDVIICNQVYQCLPNPKKMANEMYRVLKPGGTVFFGGRNNLTPLEGQTGLPFMHLISEGLALFFRDIFNLKYFPVRCLNIWQLREMFSKFEIKDMSTLILKNPGKYNYKNLVKLKKITRFLPVWLLNKMDFLMPNFIFLLKKPFNKN